MPEAPFDKAELLARVGGDWDLLREIVGLFLAEGPVRVAEIRKAIDGMDTATLMASAHALKGAVSVFGARPAVEAALRLEQLGRAGNLAHAREGLTLLDETMTALMPALEALMKEESPCGS